MPRRSKIEELGGPNYLYEAGEKLEHSWSFNVASSDHYAPNLVGRCVVCNLIFGQEIPTKGHTTNTYGYIEFPNVECKEEE